MGNVTGDPSLCKSQILLKAIIHSMQQEGEGFCVEFGAFTVEGQPEFPSVPSLTRIILDRYGVVFKMSKGQPPTQVREHAICLDEGMRPISVRPYQYAQAQKDEIERLMAEMLQGIV